ncbi:putative MFS transporter [Aspergillus clavatus NRRL 1]|uniref:MFS transporter, putative n=1 Tax=Aspergillus clavatus (strain ATCC 1007 / CBS 513.65 / DSM 816 / NCTC 3887 / NRRL 1 / QM 1276 / 107) TaxID=344612 RepID=A1C999_ASPCL|nr:MFS transporter, putative [Aspergillus clavatus NRRL 1]EAW13423.1 MFS transporter, putative [Aspergillus clavatus NRRL 1]
MSLVQHVSAIEGVDREPDLPDDETITTFHDDSFVPIRHKISYDVFPDRQPPVTDDTSGTPAYKVSTTVRLAQVLITILACWFASGIVFGFAALKPVLVEEGVYRDLCTDEELADGVELCHQQDLQLNFFFTISSITANVSALPVGTILDRYGSRVCGFAGCALLATGSALMALSFSRPGFDGYIVANFFLALGGTFIFVPSFQIANAFPKHAGIIVALVTGAFDASAAVYLFYRLVYEQTHEAFTPQEFFLGYLAVPAFILVALLTVMPRTDYQSTQQLEVKIEKAKDATRDIHESDAEIESDAELRRVRNRRAKQRRDKMRQIDEVLGDEAERRQRDEHEEERHAASAVWGVLHGLPAHAQMATPWFILITLLTVLQMLRMNYFIATIRAQYEFMLGSEDAAERINDFFDVALPLGGVLATPFIGLLLDHLSVPTMLTLIVLLTTLIGGLNSVPATWAAYTTVSLFVLLRPLYYSPMSPANTLNLGKSDYATKVFGFATFGRVYGSIICISGLVNFSQYALDALTHGPFAGNPIPINIFLAAAGFVVGMGLVLYVYVASGRLREKREMLAEGEEEERERLIPIEEEDV